MQLSYTVSELAKLSIVFPWWVKQQLDPSRMVLPLSTPRHCCTRVVRYGCDAKVTLSVAGPIATSARQRAPVVHLAVSRSVQARFEFMFSGGKNVLHSAGTMRFTLVYAATKSRCNVDSDQTALKRSVASSPRGDSTVQTARPGVQGLGKAKPSTIKYARTSKTIGNVGLVQAVCW